MQTRFSKDIKAFKMTQTLTENLSYSTDLESLVSEIPEIKPKRLFRYIFETTSRRPKYVYQLADLLSLYFKYRVPCKSQTSLRKFILDFSFEKIRKQHFQSLISLLHLLRGLITNNVILSSEFVASLATNEASLTATTKLWLFCFFAPEIESSHCELFNKLMQIFSHMASASYLPRPLHSFFHSLDVLRLNKWKLMKESFTNARTLEEAIMNDDLDFLIEASSSSYFDFSQHLELSLFQRSGFLFEKQPTLLETAAFYGSVKCFKFLLLNAQFVDFAALSEFVIAGGNNEIVRIAYNHGCRYKEALTVAIKYHHCDLTSWICEAVISDMDVLTIDNAIMTAAESNNIDALEYFQSERMDTRVYEKALHRACQFNAVETAKYILSIKGVNSATKNDIGLTHLHEAAINGTTELVRVLLSIGNIDLTVQDDTGETAYRLAKLNQKQKIAELLRPTRSL